MRILSIILCSAMLALSACTGPLVTVYDGPPPPEAAPRIPVYAEPVPPPAPNSIYVQGHYGRPDFYTVQDHLGRDYYCFKPTIPVQVEEPAGKFLGMKTVKYKVKCRDPRTGALTDASDQVVPLVSPY